MKGSLKNILRRRDHLVISINPKIYPLEVVHSAAYAMIDRAYAIIDGDPTEEIFVELRPKNKKDMKGIEFQFANELVNYAVYYQQAKLNKEVRETLMQRVFSTNAQVTETPLTSSKTSEEPGVKERIDDPLGIAKPWTPPRKVNK